MMSDKKTAKLDSEYQLISSSNEYFDDYPVCRTMKKAEKEGRELSREEIEEAMLKANTQN
jgi:hypothetical protein